ncbi:Nucleolar GTP-binding protein 1 [Diplonema papillatum]|nr:Nucleolar GTP-binding protein 1 [Diplonema papillatum]
MVLYNFKQIEVVPKSKEFIDIVLSKTQRKTPTVVHKGYQITRIRAFYMRKVKFTQTSIHEKLTTVLDRFPRLDDIHPFYAELMNVLYDRDHYKAALGRVNTTRHYIDQLGREYVRLLKYGDSLYRCKQLKRAALGRMATLLKKLEDSLGYLEQVRQHLSRLPSIDPDTRTLLVCGFPNVGKSSFMNRVTRADVDVQPYAFTTKSLFVGHTDYRTMAWQVIDTPGVLDTPLDQCSTIEMQSITALAHLKACILYFMDISGTCNHSVEQQLALFKNISPLFAGKPLVIVLNKCDLLRFADADPADQQAIKQAAEESGADIIEVSTLHDEGVGDLKTKACEILLAHRQEAKVRGKKYNDIDNRIYCAMPDSRDERQRPAFIPPSVQKVKELKANGGVVPQRPTEKDLELANGGPGVYTMDHRKNYLLDNEDWKYDLIPEIVDGKNILDFIDPDIEQRLRELEEEEEARLEELVGTVDEEDDGLFKLDTVSKEAVKQVKETVALMRIENAARKARGRGKMGRVGDAVERHQSLVHKERSRKRKRPEDDDGEVERAEADATTAARAMSTRARSTSTVRSTARTRFLSGASKGRDRGVIVGKLEGLKSGTQKLRAVSLARAQTRSMARDSRQGESDRHHYDMKPKWLFTGKMKVQGKRRSR